MKFTNFHYKYLSNYRISKEQKSIFLPEDLNVNILNYDEHNQTNELLDFLASDSFIPLIWQATRITSHFDTLLDNIFSMAIDPDIILQNIGLSDCHDSWSSASIFNNF